MTTTLCRVKFSKVCDEVAMKFSRFKIRIHYKSGVSAGKSDRFHWISLENVFHHRTHSISSCSAGAYYPFTIMSLDNKSILLSRQRCPPNCGRIREWCGFVTAEDIGSVPLAACLNVCTIHFQYPFFVTRTSTMCSVSEEYGGHGDAKVHVQLSTTRATLCLIRRY